MQLQAKGFYSTPFPTVGTDEYVEAKSNSSVHE